MASCPFVAQRVRVCCARMDFRRSRRTVRSSAPIGSESGRDGQGSGEEPEEDPRNDSLTRHSANSGEKRGQAPFQIGISWIWNGTCPLFFSAQGRSRGRGLGLSEKK